MSPPFSAQEGKKVAWSCKFVMEILINCFDEELVIFLSELCSLLLSQPLTSPPPSTPSRKLGVQTGQKWKCQRWSTEKGFHHLRQEREFRQESQHVIRIHNSPSPISISNSTGFSFRLNEFFLSHQALLKLMDLDISRKILHCCLFWTSTSSNWSGLSQVSASLGFVSIYALRLNFQDSFIKAFIGSFQLWFFLEAFNWYRRVSS